MKNELRIGNIVEKLFDSGHDGNGYWDWSIFRPEEFFEIDEYPHCFRPINLTPEWFMRLGGVQSSESDYYIEIDPNTSINYNSQTGEVTVLEIDDGCIRLWHIKSVHQLQNLYFAITNKELTVKI